MGAERRRNDKNTETIRQDNNNIMSMSKKWIGKVILGMSVTIAVPAFSQQNIKLEDCISQAFENNLQIKNAEYQKSISSLGIQKSKMNILPSVNAYYNHTLAESYSDYDYATSNFETSSTQGGRLGISVSVPLFKGLENYYSIRQTAIYNGASEYYVEQIKNDVSLQIANIFIKAVFYRDLIKLSDEQIALTALQIEKMKKYIDAGTHTKHELLKLQYQLSQEEVTLREAENNYRQSCVRLANSMNWDLSLADSLNLIAPDIDNIAIEQIPSLAEIYTNALNIYPQIKTDSLKTEAIIFDEKIAISRALPQVSLDYNYSKWYSSGDVLYPGHLSSSEIFQNTYQSSLGVKLTIPILNRGDVLYQKKTAQISLKQARLNAEDNKSALYQEIIFAHDNYLLALKKMKMQQQALKTARESFDISEKKLSAGVHTILDYTIEKTNLMVSETNLLNAQYEYIFALKILDFYQGKPIKL